MFSFFKVNEQSFYNELFKDKIDTNKIQKYIQKGVDLNKKDEKGRTVLYNLALKRKKDVIKLLLKSNIDINSEDMYGKTVLDECIDKSDFMMISFLLENGASVNRLNSSHRTVLHDIALDGNYRIFQLLMDYNPDFNVKDSYGRTALFDAIQGGNLQILNEIIDNIKTLNTIDQNHQSALFHAVLKEDIALARALIKGGIDINIIDKFGQNVLFNAILQGSNNLEILALLIQKDIDINIIDKENRNILDEILYINDLQNSDEKELHDKYRLITKNKEYLKITHLLIENGLEIDKHDNNDRTTFQKAIDNKNFANAKFLIQCGANINASDINGNNILALEVLKGYSNYQMIDFLIDNGANIEQKDLDEKNIVDKLVEIILIQKGFKRVDPFTEVKIEADEKYDLLLKKVLTYRPNLDIQRLDGRNVLFDLVSYNDFDTLRNIINAGININIQDKRGNTPLFFMVEEGLKILDKKNRDLFIERLVFFLKFRVDVDLQNEDGRTVFHQAVIADDLAVVEKLLTKKANLSLKDKHGRTALHHTQWNGNYKIARWLISSGADMNIPDNSGFTLLNYAAIFGHVKLVTTLIVSGVLMYNHNPKNRKVAKFFKERESNLQKLLINNITDDKMQKALKDVIENLKKEIKEALRG